MATVNLREERKSNGDEVKCSGVQVESRFTLPRFTLCTDSSFLIVATRVGEGTPVETIGETFFLSKYKPFYVTRISVRRIISLM